MQALKVGDVVHVNGAIGVISELDESKAKVRLESGTTSWFAQSVLNLKPTGRSAGRIVCVSTVSSNRAGDDFETASLRGVFCSVSDAYSALFAGYLDDVLEPRYTHVVLEELEQGIHPEAREVAWFETKLVGKNDRRVVMEEVPRPAFVAGVCKFAV